MLTAAIAFTAGASALLLGYWLYCVVRDKAEDRRFKSRMADRHVANFRQRQQSERYLRDEIGRPE